MYTSNHVQWTENFQKRSRSLQHTSFHLFFGAHEDGKVNQAIGVAPLVVVPTHQLHEGVVESNACADVHNRRCRPGHEICGHHFLVCEIQNTFHATTCSFLDLGYNLVHLGRLLQGTCQINNRHIWSRNTESHASQFAVQFWQALAASLCHHGLVHPLSAGLLSWHARWSSSPP